MDLQVDTGSLAAVGVELSAIHAEVMTASATAGQAGLSGAFSTAPALDMLGSAHGNVLAGPAGSARQVLTALAAQVAWLREAVLASAEVLEQQNYAGTHALAIAEEGGSVAPATVVFPVRPPLTPLPFPFPTPVAKSLPSVAALVAAFSGTNLAAVTAAAAAWTSLATRIGEVAVRLGAVAGRLGSDNRGEVITAAVAKILGVASAARSFSANAGIMATQVAKLLGIHQIGLAKVTAAQSMLDAQTDSAVRAASEAAFVAAFPAEFTPIAITAVPSIRLLMNWAECQGGGIVSTGMDTVTGGHLPSAIDVSPEAMVTKVLDEVAPHRAEVERIVSEVPELGAKAGEVHQALSATPTQAASYQTSAPGGSVAPSGMASTGIPGSAASGVSSGAGYAGHSALAAAPSALGGVLNSGAGQSSALGTGSHRGVSAGSAIPLRTADTHLASSSVGDISPRASAGGTSLGTGLPPVGGKGLAAGAAGAGGVVGLGAATGLGSSSAHSGTLTQAASGMFWSGASTGGAGGDRPVGMMGGMHPQQATRSKNKIKTVTSSVEENENIAALLGKRTPVVPGVIGAWVRG